ncbi:ribosome assembly protein YhbY [Moraxella caviae]|uniref:RNA-binding protein HI_1333 n=1 Tax=Moraxella caviae TaxID=34060 RepID=A0A1T0A134_9GAMM|nr:YhbY family RNA-binding protein [Moraxella caviae]OOR89440.1 ribosome assembly protein YhbY [Moraxella caviae]STZ09837.1 RNA-binding protein HI_1333 [Moraxella caviae]
MNAKKKRLQDLKALRGIGHKLNPIVTVGGNGLSPTLIEEVSRALSDHELIKVKIPAGSAEERRDCADALADATESAVIHHIGRMVLLLRQNPDANDKLSNLARFGF